MLNKYMKTCSVPSVGTETQIKTNIDSTIPTRMAKWKDEKCHVLTRL